MDMDALLFDGLLIFFFLLISAFFSASETGITASSRARIHKLKLEGNRRAQVVSQLRKDKERLIGGILFGNNVVNVALSAVATALCIRLFGHDGVAIATFAITILLVIFGEVMPKSYALGRPEKVALTVAPLLAVCVKIFSPVTLAVQFFVRTVFRWIGITDKPGDMLSGADVLRGAIELGHMEGSVMKADRDMLGSILDLSETEVGEIMIHRKHIAMLDADAPIDDLIDTVLQGTHSRLPVYRGSSDNIIGVLHVKGLLKLLKKKDQLVKPETITAMLKKPWFIPETTKLNDQLHAFMRAKNHLALVVDEYGSLMGLVTLEDILEEIVGQIEDEHDIGGLGIRKDPAGGYLVEGALSIRDLNRQLDWNLPDEEANTIAGLIMHEAQLIPEVGQSFKFFGFKFEILKKQRNQLLLIRVKKLKRKETA